MQQVKIQGGRKIRRLHHQQSQYRYETTTADIKHQENHQHHHHPQQQQHSTNQHVSASEPSPTITFAPQPHRQQQQHHHHHQQQQHNQHHSVDENGSSSSSSPTNNVQHHQRMKRSISSPRHVETLIVADSTMVAFHDEVESYLLTIMNMVSALYKDPSIGNAIEIVVVKIILLDEDEAHPDLNLTQNAQQNLDTFCR